MSLLHQVLTRSAGAFDAPHHLPQVEKSHLVLGFLIAAVAPGVFWSVLAKVVAMMLGFVLSWTAVALIGMAITFFLGCIYACILRSP